MSNAAAASASAFRAASARLTALTTARSDAVTMLAWMPDAPERLVVHVGLDVGRRGRVRAGSPSRARGSRGPRPRPRSGARSASTSAAIGPLPSPSTSSLLAVDAQRGRRAGRRRPRSSGCTRASSYGALVRRGSARVNAPCSSSAVSSPPRASVIACTLLREVDLQPARQLEVVLGLHQVRDAALAGLRVDADDRLVAAADVLRVDRQVRHVPDRRSRTAPARPCPS